jgi:hypothetical protein
MTPPDAPRDEPPPAEGPVRVPGPDLSGQDEAAERAVDLRLASLHLRLGSTGLARAELEAAHAAQPLAGGALLDLAEVRWRTGDVAAAGRAAEAWLAAGGEGLLGSLIAVEAAMADGRPSEARGLFDALPPPSPEILDLVFNGMPRSAMWPSEAGPGSASPGGPPADRSALVDAGRPPGRPAAPASTDPVAELEAARAALEAGDADGAAVRLSVVLRLAPHLAPAVLDLVEGVAGPMLGLVRGDAYRLVGRETEAERAWRSAATDIAGPAGVRGRRASEPARAAPSVALPAGARPGSADRARERRESAPEPEEIP